MLLRPWSSRRRPPLPAVVVVVALALHGQGCHWILPLGAGADADAASRADSFSGTADGAAPPKDSVSAGDTAPAADAAPGDGSLPVDGTLADQGCKVPPGACVALTDWTISSGNCGPHICEKTCGPLVIWCEDQMGQMRCQCEACGVLVGAPFPAIGNADTALDNALQAGRCIP